MQHTPWFIRAFGEAIELPSALKRNDAVLHPMNMEYGTLWMSPTFYSHRDLLRVMGIVKPVDAEQRIAGKHRPRSGQQGRVKNHTADLKSALPEPFPSFFHEERSNFMCGYQRRIDVFGSEKRKAQQICPV